MVLIVSVAEHCLVLTFLDCYYKCALSVCRFIQKGILKMLNENAEESAVFEIMFRVLFEKT